jgi:hypothetical protein
MNALEISKWYPQQQQQQQEQQPDRHSIAKPIVDKGLLVAVRNLIVDRAVPAKVVLACMVKG